MLWQNASGSSTKQPEWPHRELNAAQDGPKFSPVVLSHSKVKVLGKFSHFCIKNEEHNLY
jgi:hypothetical protein